MQLSANIAAGIWPGELAEVATRLAINMDSCVNAATQHAGVAALLGPQEPVDAMLATFASAAPCSSRL